MWYLSNSVFFIEKQGGFLHVCSVQILWSRIKINLRAISLIAATEEVEEVKDWAYVFRNVSKVNVQTKHTKIASFQSRSAGLVVWPYSTKSLQTPSQIMSSTLASESSLCWEDTKCIHVFVQKCGVIKLVSFSDVVQEMPHRST